MLKELALSLSLKCLSYDFVGTSIDESSEEFGTVQIPSGWKPVTEDPSTLRIFFDYYAITDAPLSKEMHTGLKTQILASQPSDQQQQLSQCFDKLMGDVALSLDSKNRDRFAQNLTLFWHEFKVK